jgi:ubiquinone/menaquinone biosynthesis C-methylase UbiE
MHIKKIHTLLRCPYCTDYFTLKNAFGSFGTATCSCTSFPIIENVIFIQKSDSLLNKQLVALIQQQKYQKAVWVALTHQRITHRIIVFTAYFLKKKCNITIPLHILLSILKVVGPARSWFEYLLSSEQRATLQTAITIFKSHTKRGTIIDIGCGIGTFFKIIKEQKLHKYTRLIGIDKSFLSLLIASMYTHSSENFYICTDIEHGLPFKKNTSDSIYCTESFAWIYNKLAVVNESARILKQSGYLNIINIHQESKETNAWGYGITALNLKRLLHTHFTRILFLPNTLLPASKIRPLSIREINPQGYSCIAQKK